MTENECILWHQVSFKVKKSWFDKLVQLLNANPAGMRSQVILTDVSAKIELNKLNAILGPSGSGKSTLLKALLCKQGQLPLGYSGQVGLLTNTNDWLIYPTKHEVPPTMTTTTTPTNDNRMSTIDSPEMLLSYVPQLDELHAELTVIECLQFEFDCKYVQSHLRVRMQSNPLLLQSQAYTRMLESKSKKSKQPSNLSKSALRRLLIETLLEKLLLLTVKNNFVSRCSGGERKRVAIACELLCLPNLLLLDEPTTGLDSSSSLQLIQFLATCVTTQPNLTVLCIIHQPSFPLFTCFHHVHVLGKNGHPVYSGQPTMLLDRLGEHGLVCPNFYNPADFVLDVANGDFGEAILEQLKHEEQAKLEAIATSNHFKAGQEMTYESNHQTQPEYTVVGLDSQSLASKYVYDLSRLPKQMTGFSWTHFFLLLWQGQITSLRDRTLLIVRFGTIVGFMFFFVLVHGTKPFSYPGCPSINLIQKFDPAQLEYLLEANKEEITHVRDTTGMMFTHTVIPLYVCAMIPAFVFPQELRIFLLHRRNLLYSTASYVSAKTMADIPLLIILTGLYTVGIYFLQGGPPELFRVMIYTVSYILGSTCIQGMGYLTGSMFLNNANASVFLTPLVSIPLFAFVKRIKNVPFVFPILNYGHYLSYAGGSYSGAILALYGYQRCGVTMQSTFTNFTQQLRWFLEDSFGVQVEDLQSDPNQQQQAALMLPIIIPKWRLAQKDDQMMIMCGDVQSGDSPCIASNGLFDARLLVNLVRFANNLTEEIVKQAETISFNGSVAAINTIVESFTTEAIWSDQVINTTTTLISDQQMMSSNQIVLGDFDLITSSNQTRIESSDQTSTGISAKFIDSMMKLINGQFIDKKDGQIKSFAIIDMGYDDDNAWFYILSLVGLFIGFRVVSFFFVYLHTKNK